MTLSEQIRMLSGADFLEPLSEEQLEKFAARCPDIFYKQGEILSIPCQDGEGFFYILKQGRVRVYELGPGGQEHTLTEIRDGTAFAAQRLDGAYAQPWSRPPSLFCAGKTSSTSWGVVPKWGCGL